MGQFIIENQNYLQDLKLNVSYEDNNNLIQVLKTGTFKIMASRARFQHFALKNSTVRNKAMDGVKDAGMAPIQRYVDTGENDVGIRVAMGQSIALTHRYEWGAQFSFPGSPKVIVPTTPRGILELFNDRDKPESLDPRKALKHWVSEHIRRAKCGSFQHVISHLRGELKFSWRGFDVEIKPAQFDLEKIEANKK